MSGTTSQPAKHREWRWKRTVVMALLLLIGGAVVNVAVAWRCAWHDVGLQQTHFVGKAYQIDDDGWATKVWELSHYEGRGTKAFFSVWSRVRTPLSRYEGHTHPAGDVPRWLGFENPPEEFRNESHFEFVQWGILRGWPLRSLGCILDVPRYPEASHRIRMAIEPGGSSGAFSTRLLPLRPVFPGFIINSFFYAAILSVLIFIPFAARRMIRRRRGLCAKCAYPVGTSPVCTECGAAVQCRSET